MILNLCCLPPPIIDYDYIMNLIARYTEGETRQTEAMTREQLIGLIASDAKFMDEREDIAAYIDTLEVGKALNKQEIRAGYEALQSRTERPRTGKDCRQSTAWIVMLCYKPLWMTFMQRMIFDGEQLSDLLAPLGLGWKERAQKERP